MAAEAQLHIEVSAANNASKVLKDIDKDAHGLGKTLGDVGKIAGGFLAANVIAGGLQKVTGFIGDSIDAASDLNEVMSKTNAVFKGNAAEITAWAAGGAKDFGLSKRAALDAASGFGNMFDQLGLTADASTGMSRSIVELGADFASFHNADITDVLDAQSAAFRGEYDSLQRFLPLINAASVQQKAMEMTGKGNADALTAQDKALATYQLMLEGAGQAAGDFDKTSGALANTTRIQQAEMENLQATIGTKLLPVQLAITRAKMAMVEVLVTQVIPVLEELYARHWPAISAAINDVVAFIQTRWPQIQPVIQFAAEFVITRIQGMIQVIQGVVQVVTGVIDLVSALFHGEWAAAWEAMKQIAEGILNILIGNLKYQFGSIPGIIWGVLVDAHAAAVGLAQGIVDGVINTLASLPQTIYDTARYLIGQFWQGFVDARDWLIGNLKGWANDVINSVKSGFGIFSPSTVFRDIGENIVRGLANGIKNDPGSILKGALDGVIGGLKSTFGGVAGAIGGALGLGGGGGGGIGGAEQWRALVARYFPADQVNNALRIIAAESGGSPGAISPMNTNGSRDVGLFQINDIHGLSVAQRLNAEANVAFAAGLYRASGWRPWTTAPGLGLRAAGGPVTAGKPYIVGERGPELFVPGSSGGILPNGAGGISISFLGPVSFGGSRGEAERAVGTVAFSLQNALAMRGIR